MSPRRRLALLQLAALPLGARSAAGDSDGSIARGRTLTFPRDHGAHLGTRTEWWYATAWLGTEETPTHGVQITFFRSRTGFGLQSQSRFAPRHLLFAHAAVTALPGGTHVHSQRIARWAENASAIGHVAVDGGNVQLQGWQLQDRGSHWLARASGADFAFELQLSRTQPLLLQGDAGFSRKGPEEANASHYYSEVQLAAAGRLTMRGRSVQTQGRCWLDHEWSNALLHPLATGWDWIGINLFDGGALTAFRLRTQGGAALWAGGSHRAAGAAVAPFASDAVRWTPGRTWRSPSSGATYPVEWLLECPVGRFRLRTLADAQELDSRSSTGTIYWEGVSELLDTQGRRVGLGYLEMTGYAAPIKV